MSDKCECGHSKKYHNHKDGCHYRYPRGSQADYKDNLNYCCCIEFYQITAAPYTGQSFNTIGTELMRSDVFKVKCEEVVTKKKETITDVFQYDVRLTNNDSVLRIEGDVGEIVDGKRSITGMIVLYENGRIEDHMVSFRIDLSSTGEFFESIDVDGTSPSGKTWMDNKTYRVLISYNGEQITEDFRK